MLFYILILDQLRVLLRVGARAVCTGTLCMFIDIVGVRNVMIIITVFEETEIVLRIRSSNMMNKS